MPIDKHPKLTAKKPITPALSSRFRNTKTAVTPRLAGSAPASPVVASKKDLKIGALPATEVVQSPPLNGNVTPRSGARSSRIGTESPGTPGTLRRPSNTGSTLHGSAASTPSVESGAARFIVNSTTQVAGHGGSDDSTATGKDDSTSKFFYAGDMRPTTGSPLAAPLNGMKSPVAGFVWTGDNVTTSKELHSVSDSDEKFFRANDIPSHHNNRAARPGINKQVSSTSTASLRTRSPEISRPNSTQSRQISPRRPMTSGQSRPGSPTKNLISSPHMIALPDSPSARRYSVSSNNSAACQGVRPGHAKSASVSTLTSPNNFVSTALPKLRMPDQTQPHLLAGHLQPSATNEVASPDSVSPRSASLNSSKTVCTTTTAETEVSDIAKIILAVKESQTNTEKPLMSSQAVPTPQIQAQTDAANARRERKVLDLEISNSSLLAINKTLERELRKQSAELRRFRRLSRSGRLSFAPTNRSISSQSMLSALAEQADEDEFTPDSSDEENEDESDLSNPDDENLSDTDSVTARSRQRARDERRLLLDLSKHQQLLVDSQKLSQSIRKCLNLTEELIKDANKALEYKVGIGDVKLGGRVLSNDDDDVDAETHGYDRDEGQTRKGLLSPSLTHTELREASMWLGGVQCVDGGEEVCDDNGMKKSELALFESSTGPMVHAEQRDPG